MHPVVCTVTGAHTVHKVHGSAYYSARASRAPCFVHLQNIHSFPSWTDVRALKRPQPLAYVAMSEGAPHTYMRMVQNSLLSVLDGCARIEATTTNGLHTYMVTVRNTHSCPSWTDARASKRPQPMDYTRTW